MNKMHNKSIDKLFPQLVIRPNRHMAVLVTKGLLKTKNCEPSKLINVLCITISLSLDHFVFIEVFVRSHEKNYAHYQKPVPYKDV